MTGTRITTGRKSHARQQTWCTSCEAWIGVWSRNYRGGGDAYSQQRTYKIHRHFDEDGRLCGQSGLAIPKELVMDA